MKVKLFLAYSWECPRCGAGQFCKSVPISKEEQQNIAMSDVIVPLNMELVTSPNTVLCDKCFELYDTEEYGDEYFDETLPT